MEKYKYTLRVKGGSSTYSKVLIACDERVTDGILYFFDENDGWFYSCSLHNLVDMEVEEYKTVNVDDQESKDLLRELFGKKSDEEIDHTLNEIVAVLPKEHT